jgi:hypothetical protein
VADGWRLLILVETFSVCVQPIVDARGTWRLSQLHFLYARPSVLRVNASADPSKFEGVAVADGEVY